MCCICIPLNASRQLVNAVLLALSRWQKVAPPEIRRKIAKCVLVLYACVCTFLTKVNVTYENVGKQMKKRLSFLI